MTDQAYDVLQYQDRTYLIAGIAGDNYFTPAAYGLTVRDGASCNWRGWTASFAVSSLDKTLCLLQATLWLDQEKYDWHHPPQLLGVPGNPKKSLFGVTYQFDLQPPVVPLTGGLLVDEYLADWRPAPQLVSGELQRHQNVRELIFEDGVLVEEYDSTHLIRARESGIAIKKARWKRTRQLDDTVRNRLAFDYEDARLVRDT